MQALRMRSLGLCLAAAGLIALSAAASARADTVTDWNANAVNALVTTAGQSPTVSTVPVKATVSAAAGNGRHRQTISARRSACDETAAQIRLARGPRTFSRNGRRPIDI